MLTLPTQEQFLLLLGVVFANVLTYFLYYADKKRAKNGQKRISESRLLVSAFMLGGVGAAIAMTTLRHKTKKIKFKLLIPLAVLVSLATIFLILMMSN